MKPGMQIILIALGGACGAVSRYYLAVATNALHQTSFPWGTFVANILGSFLIGILIGTGKDQQNEALRLAFGIGFLGSLTTFSTFSAETVAQISDGNIKMATLNTVANVICCMLATFAGITLTKRLFS